MSPGHRAETKAAAGARPDTAALYQRPEGERASAFSWHLAHANLPWLPDSAWEVGAELSRSLPSSKPWCAAGALSGGASKRCLRCPVQLALPWVRSPDFFPAEHWSNFPHSSLSQLQSCSFLTTGSGAFSSQMGMLLLPPKKVWKIPAMCCRGAGPSQGLISPAHIGNLAQNSHVSPRDVLPLAGGRCGLPVVEGTSKGIWRRTETRGGFTTGDLAGSPDSMMVMSLSPPLVSVSLLLVGAGDKGNGKGYGEGRGKNKTTHFWSK